MPTLPDFCLLTDVRLLNPYGPLQTAQPFQPFGAQPQLGACLMIESPALRTQAWEAIAIEIDWKEPRGDFDFAEYYAAYNAAANGPVFFNSAFRVSASLRLESQWQAMQISDPCLFQPVQGVALWTSRFVLRPVQPIVPTTTQAPDDANGAQFGCIKLELTGPAAGFGAALYAQVFTSAIAQHANPALLNTSDLTGMPVTPLAERITVAIRKLV